MPSKSSKSLIYEHVCLLNHQKTHQTLIFCSLPPKKRWYPIYPYIPVNTRKYPTYPEIPENTRHTRKYPRVKKIPGNTRSYISTLLPDPTRPATRYFVQYPTRPDPILKNPTRWALNVDNDSWLFENSTVDIYTASRRPEYSHFSSSLSLLST